MTFWSGYATDAKNSERRITEVDQLSPGLSREYLIKGFEDKDVQAILASDWSAGRNTEL